MLLKNKKILFVTGSFSKSNLAGSERVFYFVNELSKYNNVNVLTRKEDDYYLISNVKIISEIKTLILNKYIKRILSPFPDNEFLDYLFFIFNFRKISNDYDIIITSGPPHSIHLIGWFYKKMFKCSFICDLRDGWKTNHLYNYGTVFHKMISNFLYKKLLSTANLILSNTDELTLLMKQDFNNIITVKNGYPRNYFDDSLNKTVIKYDFLYSGGTYGTKAVKIINKLFSYVNNKENTTSVHFLGEEFSDTSVCKYIGKVTSENVSKFLYSANILVLYLDNKELNSPRVLLKAYGYAKTGKPVLYIGPKNATYSFLKKYVNVFQVDENISFSDFEKIIFKLKHYVKEGSCNKIIDDFSYENNFEKLINEA
jgi:hypothetical protein